MGPATKIWEVGSLRDSGLSALQSLLKKGSLDVGSRAMAEDTPLRKGRVVIEGEASPWFAREG